jgi:hypothetical protein
MHPGLRLVLALPPHLKLLCAALLAFTLISTSSSLFVLFLTCYGHRLRSRNTAKRRIALESVGITEEGGKRRRVVGFFHPYW